MSESAGFLGAKYQKAKEYVNDKMGDEDFEKNIKNFANQKIDQAKEFLNDKSQDANGVARGASREASRDYRQARDFASQKVD